MKKTREYFRRISRAIHSTCVFALAVLVISAATIPAQAGSARVSAISNGGRNVLLPFSVACVYPNGDESNHVKYSVWTGSSTRVSGCDEFTIYYTSSRGVRYEYDVYPGRSYYFEWNGDHWGFYEN